MTSSINSSMTPRSARAPVSRLILLLAMATRACQWNINLSVDPLQSQPWKLGYPALVLRDLRSIKRTHDKSQSERFKKIHGDAGALGADGSFLFRQSLFPHRTQSLQYRYPEHILHHCCY